MDPRPETVPRSGTATSREGQNPGPSGRGACQQLENRFGRGDSTPDKAPCKARYVPDHPFPHRTGPGPPPGAGGTPGRPHAARTGDHRPRRRRKIERRDRRAALPERPDRPLPHPAGPDQTGRPRPRPTRGHRLPDRPGTAHASGDVSTRHAPHPCRRVRFTESPQSPMRALSFKRYARWQFEWPRKPPHNAALASPTGTGDALCATAT